jgi:hypothetical protein
MIVFPFSTSCSAWQGGRMSRDNDLRHGAQMIRRISPYIFLPAIMAFGACSAGEATRTAAGVGVCESRSTGSRWASQGGYIVSAQFAGREEQPLWRILGVAAGDSLLYVYDGPNHTVEILDHSLRTRGHFGRSGQGPGEFGSQSRGIYPPDLTDRRIDIAGDSVMVFSGDRVQVFTAGGEYIGQLAEREIRNDQLSLFTMRIRYRDGRLNFADRSYRHGRSVEERSRFSVIVSRKRGPSEIRSIPAEPLPTTGGPIGPTVVLREQARPIWDIEGGCIVLGDGSQGKLLVATTSQLDRVDTIRFTLRDIPQPPYDPAQEAAMIAMASRGQAGRVKPTAPRRLDAITIDPDGYAWILPYQDPDHLGGDIELLRVSLETGVAQWDTVPAFPVAFGRPGVYFGRALSAEDQAVIYRIDSVSRPSD